MCGRSYVARSLVPEKPRGASNSIFCWTWKLPLVFSLPDCSSVSCANIFPRQYWLKLFYTFQWSIATSGSSLHLCPHWVVSTPKLLRRKPKRDDRIWGGANCFTIFPSHAFAFMRVGVRTSFGLHFNLSSNRRSERDLELFLRRKLLMCLFSVSWFWFDLFLYVITS